MSTRAYKVVKRLGMPMGLRLGTFEQYRARPLLLAHLCEQELGGSDGGSGGLLMAIVTPSLNQSRFLYGAMESVLGQGVCGVRYAVVDGGSIDESSSIIESRSDALFWHCIEKDSGQSHGINKGFEVLLSSTAEDDEPAIGPADVMGWLNADDRFVPGCLCFIKEYFESNPDVDVVYGHRIVVNDDGQEVGRWVVPSHLSRSTLWGHYVPQETMFWRRRVWEAAGGGVDEELSFAMDWDLFVRLERAALSAGNRVVRLDRFLGIFTTHKEQKSIILKEQVGRAEFGVVRDRYCGHGWERMMRRAQTYFLLIRSIFRWWKWKIVGR